MNSVRTRLLVLLIAVVALTAAAVGAITYAKVLDEVESLFDYQLRQIALSLRDQGEQPSDEPVPLGDEELDVVIQIWSADGRTVYASRRHRALPARAVLGFADIVAEGVPWRTFSVTARGRVIQVAQPVQTRRRFAAEAALRSVLPLLVLGPLLVMAVGAVVTVSLRPLERLARQARQRDAESLAPLAVEGLPDEAAPLVQALNALLARLSAAFDTQRAFVADAAHELRSPLTALRLQVDLLRRAPDDASRREAVETLAAGVDRASRLVEQLLTLARSERGAAAEAGSQRPIDLVELARRVLADQATIAASRGSTLELEAAEEPIAVGGDGDALGALVRNLADNALRYSPAGSRVVVRVERDAQGAPRLLVDDSGPGIPPSERARAFDRFWRGGPAREPGSGLGLAIARSVVERHGGRIELLDSPLGGLRVQVAFPASPNAG